MEISREASGSKKTRVYNAGLDYVFMPFWCFLFLSSPLATRLSSLLFCAVQCRVYCFCLPRTAIPFALQKKPCACARSTIRTMCCLALAHNASSRCCVVYTVRGKHRVVSSYTAIEEKQRRGHRPLLLFRQVPLLLLCSYVCLNTVGLYIPMHVSLALASCCNNAIFAKRARR